MNDDLTSDDLVALVRRVFVPTERDRQLALLVDLPAGPEQDSTDWLERRQLAFRWYALLESARTALGLQTVDLIYYRNVGANNADLPRTGFRYSDGAPPADASALKGEEVLFESVYASYQILIAPTEYSTTAPLKVAARRHPFRAATMPGFSAAMVPALKLDYSIIGARVSLLEQLLNEAVTCRLIFRVGEARYPLTLDLRYRKAHASSGIIASPGSAGNLPSGEAYIVPYEGELRGTPSHSSGILPVELEGEVVRYHITENRATSVVSEGPISAQESERLRLEPAYGNLAELGLGVLGDFGLEPSGSILLDEKLGLHIAFGRSEHFGGIVGPTAFSSPDKVVHLDRVYVPSLQPRVVLESAVLELVQGERRTLMLEGIYQVGFEN